MQEWNKNSFGKTVHIGVRCELWATHELVPEIFRRLKNEIKKNMFKRKKTFTLIERNEKKKSFEIGRLLIIPSHGIVTLFRASLKKGPHCIVVEFSSHDNESETATLNHQMKETDYICHLFNVQCGIYSVHEFDWI